MNGNGEKITCKVRYHNIKLNRHDYKMESDMYSIPLVGYDMMLGI